MSPHKSSPTDAAHSSSDGHPGAPTTNGLRAARPALALALLLLIHGLLIYQQDVARSPMIDFFTLWGVPHALSLGSVDNIYAPNGQRRMFSLLREEAARSPAGSAEQMALDITSRLYNDRVDATGSPLVYAVVGLLAPGPFARDRARFAALSLGCCLLSIALLVKAVDGSLLSCLLLTSFVVSGYQPVRSDMNVGNLNEVQLLIVSLFIYLTASSRRLWAAIVIGAGVMLKPNLLPIFVLALALVAIDQRRQALVTMLAGALLGAAVSGVTAVWYFHGPDIWFEFAASIPGTLGLSYTVENGNIGLPALAFLLFHQHMSLIILATIVAVFCCAAYLSRPAAVIPLDVSPPNPRWTAVAHEAFAVAGIGGAVMLLSANLVWIHYYVLVIPIAVYLMRPAGHDVSRWLPLSVTVVALLLLSEAADNLLDTTFSQAIFMNTALLLLTACMVRDFWHERRRHGRTAEIASPPAFG